MAFRYLDKDGALSFWTNIKNYILSKIPTKTSELTNDSGYLTNTNDCLHKSGGETFTGYKTVENINSGLIFKSTDYQAEIRLSGNEPYDVSIVSKNLSNNTYSYYTLMDRYGKVFPHIYRLQDSNLTVYVSNAVSNNDGDGLTANTAFSYSAIRNFLGAIRMRSSNSIGSTYTLTINLVPTGISYGICRFDSTKMPYVKNLIIQTSTGVEGTPENYTTNCPELTQLCISGNMDVTVKNIKCAEIVALQGTKITLSNFNAVSYISSRDNGYINIGGYLYVFNQFNSTAPKTCLFEASTEGHLRIDNSNTTIHFSEQCYYSAGLIRSINHAYVYGNISRWKILGIKPSIIIGGSTTVLTTCSTSGNVSAKTVETGTTIGTSSVIGVTFSETNTADNPTLNVNGLGDWPIVADNNAVDIKHYLHFSTRIIFKRSGNTWKITNTKDCLQYILSDATINLAGVISTTYNNGDFNFGDYIISQGTGCISTNVYNATQYNINGTNIFDGIRTITQPWVYTATQSIKLTTTLGGTVYQDKGIKFTDTNSASIGYLYGCTFNNGGSGVGISASNVIDNTTVSKGIRVVLTNDGKSYLYPGNPNDTSLGSEYFTWKAVYANKYYLGSTEFGDIVTHNASEFLTEHQSLANYATKQDLADLVNSAPSTLDTLNELASALGDDPNFATTVSTQIGTKANDNAVVHTSGNETVGGLKTFKSTPAVYNSDNTANTPNFTLRSSKSAIGTSNTDAQGIFFNDKNNDKLASVKVQNFTSNGSTYLLNTVNTKDTNDQTITASTSLYILNNGRKVFRPEIDNDILLGYTSNRWKEVYATNYYYGANNVEFSDKFVTTDTEQIITGTKTFNSVRGIDLSEKTIDLNDCYSTQLGGVIRYYCNTNSGTNNISNIPTNSSFSMISETYRYLSTSDYLVKQTHIANHKTRTRYCSNGTWTDWKEIVDTDVNVTNTLATTTKAYLTGTTSSVTNTGTQIFDTGVYLSTTAGELVATKFTGALNGTADKATKDGNGNVISSTYAKVSDMAEMTAEEVIAIANQILV